ncbi:MAG: cell division protein FtsK [Hamadaea sp.]|uniref:FtsK/SpoIIIE domain-containing protein n=1 Tax=Hamadaea sp. TaxID=2024425 RepID=UPI0017B1C49C|nr:FtsK/SpoIIIE domain-containing protein [Hamadaea sp.]NUT23817.1 cell division protein FtsK [Hamadaea sp.]
MLGSAFVRPAIPVAPNLSIFDPVFIGVDEFGKPVYVTMMYRNKLIGGEPGAGKSSLLSNYLAHAALSADCRLCLIDGKQVELGLWEQVADVFVGPDQKHAIRTLLRVQQVMDNRYAYLRQHRRRKITRDDAFSAILIVIDEIAYFSATVGSKTEQDMFSALLRDLVARGRAVGIIVLAATQRPSSDIIPTSLRDLFAWRFCGRTSNDSSSDIVLGHGWASKGYTANSLDPTNQGSGLLIAEGGTPKLVKAAYLTDDDVIHLADYAAYIRRPQHALAA